MSYTDSVVVEAGVHLRGVWVHDPLDPAGSVRAYPYGANSRETAVEVEQEGTVYAGRTFPVVDYGEAEVHAIGVGLTVPHGPDYRMHLAELEGWARARRTIHLRDNRGRNVRGTLSGFKHSDAGHGSEVTFTVTQVSVVDVEVV